MLWTALISNKVVAACTLSIQSNGRLMVSSVSSGAVLWSNEVQTNQAKYPGLNCHVSSFQHTKIQCTFLCCPRCICFLLPSS